MSNKIFIGLSLLLISIFSCQNNTETDEQISKFSSHLDSIYNGDEIAGLLINNCYSCHDLNATTENRIALTMSEIKSHYHNAFKTKEEFVTSMIQYVNNPTIDNVVIHKAFDKYGIMPNMQFTKTDVTHIVNYIYETAIGTDKWVLKYKNKSTPTIAEGDYIGLGRQIVMSTKKTLGKNLKMAIKNKGTKAAVSFCNLNAMPILDSMALVHDAKINRVTNRARNQENIANKLEQELIHNYQSQIENGEDLKPILKETDDIATFYMPIVTNQMCMKCHAVKGDIDTETLEEINRLYTKDMATGYTPQQIRGIWRVVMEK